MIKKDNQIEFDEFIVNPTKLSKNIVRLAEKSNKKYGYLLSSKKLKDKVKLRLLYLNEYSNIFNFIESFKKREILSDVGLLFIELEKYLIILH
ncbi:MAG: hypothetical protein PHV16_04510 [Candidatus Nanoarchaeia archaeon]|nr:hypothetical protein [Candidatus Nanoarchaeia archaeon]